MMRFSVVCSMFYAQVCRGEICRNVLGRGTRVYTRYKRWSAKGFFWTLLSPLQSLKTLCMDVAPFKKLILTFLYNSPNPRDKNGKGHMRKIKSTCSG
jgi:hypothetical protein